MRNPKVIVVLGRAGSGKGTQAKLLYDKFGLSYFGAGDALRKRQKVNDFTAKKLIKVMGRGELAPSFVISKLWIDEFEKLKKITGFKGVVCDGSPRKIVEAKYFDEALEWYEWSNTTKVILIDISEKESFKRLTKRRICQKCKKLIPYINEFKKLKKCDSCQGPLAVRADDKPSAIRQRLDMFKKEVMPVINYYKERGELIRINGEQSIEDVFKDILKSLK